MRELLLALLAAPVLASCTADACTLIYVADGLEVQVDPAGSLPPDVYTAIARADGHELSLDVRIVDAQSAGCADGRSPCRLEVEAGAHTLVLDVTLGAAGGTLITSYADGGGPAQVELELRRGATVLVTRAYTPSYQTVEPNGRGCGEVRRAEDVLAVPVQAP